MKTIFLLSVLLLCVLGGHGCATTGKNRQLHLRTDQEITVPMLRDWLGGVTPEVGGTFPEFGSSIMAMIQAIESSGRGKFVPYKVLGSRPEFLSAGDKKMAEAWLKFEQSSASMGFVFVHDWVDSNRNP